MSLGTSATVDLYDDPRFRLVLEVRQAAGKYRAVVMLNGAMVQATTRPSLSSAVRWANQVSVKLVDLFSLPIQPVPTSKAVRLLRDGLAA